MISASKPGYSFAPCKEPSEFGVTSVVLIGLVSTDGDALYLLIRYVDYETGVVEGDHLYHSLEEAFESTHSDYGIGPGDWRSLSEAEIAVVDAQIG